MQTNVSQFIDTQRLNFFILKFQFYSHFLLHFAFGDIFFIKCWFSQCFVNSFSKCFWLGQVVFQVLSLSKCPVLHFFLVALPETLSLSDILFPDYKNIWHISKDFKQPLQKISFNQILRIKNIVDNIKMYNFM